MTKSRQIEMELRTALKDGRWAIGDKLPGEHELVYEFGAARVTVRDALNSLALAGLVTRKPGVGTVVTGIPQHANVAILIEAEDLASPLGYYYHAFLRAAKELVDGDGYGSMLLVSHGDRPEDVVSSTPLFESRGIRGALTTVPLGPLESRLTAAGIACVTVGLLVPVTTYGVALDLSSALEIAKVILEERGHGDFALMRLFDNGALENPATADIERAHDQIMRRTVDFDEARLISVPWTLDMGNAYDAFKEWWSHAERPNAILFSDDGLFAMASRAILELGIRVPEELAIVTYANVGRHFRFPVPLVRIGWDPDQVAQVGWSMLRKLIEGVPVEEPVVVLPPIVTDGDSAGPRRA